MNKDFSVGELKDFSVEELLASEYFYKSINLQGRVIKMGLHETNEFLFREKEFDLFTLREHHD